MAQDKPKGAAALQFAGLAAGLAALLGLLWYAQRPAPAPAPEPLAVAQQTPAANPAPVAEPAPEPAAKPAPEPVPEPAPPAVPPEPPRFDTVRITPAGEAVVAGHALPGGRVVVQIDGSAAAQAQANDAGDFVALFTLPPSDAPRLLTLALETPGGLLASPDQVVVEPIAPPAASATATPAEPPTALLLSDAGATVLQGPVADAGAGVTIAAITYTPDGGVQLSGLGAPGQTVRLYLDNAEAGLAPVAPTGGWMATLRGIAPGLYTLRADQIDAAGTVTARFETPFQRESLQALALALKPQAVSGTPVPMPDATPSVQAETPAAPAPDAAQTAGAAPAAAGLAAPAAPAAPAAMPAAMPAAEAAPERPVTITVQPGYTLWRIARDNFGDGVQYVKVFEANKTQIRDPDLIYPGQVFTLPDR